MTGDRRRAALAVVLGVAAVGASIGLLATSGYLISKAALQPQILTLTVAIVGVRFFGIMRAVVRYLERLASHDVAFRALTNIRARLFARLVPLAPRGLDQFRRGDLLSRFVADVDSLQHVFLRGIAPPLIALGAVAIAVGVAATILPAAAVILLLALLLAATAVPAVGWVASRTIARRRNPAQAHLTAELVEVLAASPELVAYGQTEAYHRRVSAADRALTRLARRDAVVTGLTNGLATFVAACTVAAVLIVGASAVDDGRLDGVLLAVLVFLALASFEAVSPLPSAVNALKSGAVAKRRVEEIVSADVRVVDRAGARPAPTADRVTIEDGRFRYDDGPWLLDGIELTLQPGKRVALVGPSGSGKSTIALLLVRFLDLEEGRVALNGHDIREYAQADVRREIALGSQDAHIFATTIRDNIRLARPTASDADVARALASAGAWDWVASLEDGLDTFVGEDGALLSGGQRQRIALARILLSEARIVILDEPTAHLDPASAETFVRDVANATSDRGLLVITHRLDGLEHFDEVLELDRGRIRRVTD